MPSQQLPDWTDRFHYSTPQDRWILARLHDGATVEVRWNGLKQAWVDREGNVHQWEVWKPLDED